MNYHQQGPQERRQLVKDLVAINNHRYEIGEVDLDVGKRLDQHSRSSDEDEEDNEISDHKSCTTDSEDSSDSTLGSEFALFDDYDSSGNPKIDEAS